MEVGTKSMAGVNSAGAYSFSFGTLPHGTVYSGGMKVKSDLRPKLHEKLEVGLKAFSSTSGGAGTAGYAMVPIYVDPDIVDVSRKYTPLVEIFPRVTNQGTTADYNTITAKGGAYTAVEDGALPETDTTYDRNSVGIKYLYSVGRVTGVAQASNPAYMLMGFNPDGGYVGGFQDQMGSNAKQREVLVKARELKELEESLIVNGATATDATQFNGIVALQSTTNQVDKSTTALDLADIQTAIQYAFVDSGKPSLAIADAASFSDLLNLLQAKIGYMQPAVDAEFGFSYITVHTMVGPVKVVASQYLSTASGSKAIYFLDMSVWEMRVLQDMTYEDLAKTNDSEKFMLKIYECLICRNTAFNSWIKAIA